MSKPVNTHGMGLTQISVLSSLVRHTAWSHTCGWIWSTQSETLKYMETFVKRGLAKKVTIKNAWDSDEDQYRPTPAAIEFVKRQEAGA